MADIAVQRQTSIDHIRNSYKDLHGEDAPDDLSVEDLVSQTIEKYLVSSNKDGADGADVEVKDVEHKPNVFEKLEKKIADFFHPKPHENWTNWNHNQHTTGKVLKPKTLEDIQEAVKENKKVRAAANGHSWSPIIVTSEDTDTLLLNINGNLKGVISSKEDIARTSSITFEAGNSVQDLDHWLIGHGLHLTFPANVVLTEVFLVGVAASICHGAGYEWGSVCDFITSVTVVEADGHVVTYTDLQKEELPIAPTHKLYNTIKTVSADEFNHHRASLGLLGVIYAVTMRLVPDETLHMEDNLHPIEDLLDPTKLKELIEYHNGWIEIFWVPTTSHAWVKTWRRAAPNTKPEKPNFAWWDSVSNKMGRLTYFARQEAQRLGIDVPLADKAFLDLMFHGMTLGLSETEKVTNFRWYDAMHYKGSINDMRVEDTEFAIAVDEDYEKPAAAFRALKAELDEHAAKGDFPIDIVCEMRFTNGALATLAHYPRKESNKWLHIEFLSYSVSDSKKLTERLEKFTNDMAPKWQALGGRPHWAKGWQAVNGIYEYIAKNVVTDEFRQFRQRRDPTGKFLNHRLAPIFALPQH